MKIESLSSPILLVQSDDKVGRICSRLCQFISRSPSHELYVHAFYVSEGSSNKRPYPSIGPYLYGHSVSFNLNSSWIWPCFKICILSTRILNDSKADVLILELVSEELNHLAAILHVYAGSFYEVKKIYIIIFQKEKGNTFTLLIIFTVKCLQKEQIAQILYYEPQSAGINLQSP